MYMWTFLNVGEADYNFQKSEARGREKQCKLLQNKPFFKVVIAMLIFLIYHFAIYFNMSYNIFLSIISDTF